ncbi:MAG: aminotransferase class I/II-fold pyridoxal phosphate-dependent enzyme [Clostridia bacterium]|nr:aminotransferase class I/II-fold pyridoxal phosphate-dependent enzyme [Clostridia bacterium]
MGFRIYLSPPYLCGKEREYVNQAIDSNWVAPYGPALGAFEKEMARYVHIESALAVSSGTAGIHLALRWLGVEAGDYVFCQDLTFIGSLGGVMYEKAVPVFIDSEPGSWNMSPAALERALKWAKAQGKLPKAVIIVDLYGESADWDRLLPICRKYGVPVVEDAAEAVGTCYKGKKCGTFGDIGIFSFNGNKIITTSGGGMVLANNQLTIEKMRFWATQAREPEVWYEHKEYGYNYRMSNICAAIGLGQLEILPEKLRLRKQIHQRYKELLSGLPVRIKGVAEKGSSNYWLNLLILDTDAVTPLDVVTKLQNAEIESRPTWKPMHMQPLFEKAVYVTDENVYENGCLTAPDSVSEAIFARTLCLPSGEALTEEQLQIIANEIIACFE